MALEDPTSGAGYATQATLPSADMSTIATQQPRAVDGLVGTDMSADQDYTINFANGTTYKFSGTLTQNRNISLPVTGIGDYERFYLRITGELATYDLVVKELGGSTIVTISADANPQAISCYWDKNDSNWYTMHWSGSGIAINQ